MIKGVNTKGKTTELSDGSEDLRTLRLKWNFIAIRMPKKKSLNYLKIQNFGSLKDAWSEKISQVEKAKTLSTEITLRVLASRTFRVFQERRWKTIF